MVRVWRCHSTKSSKEDGKIQPSALIEQQTLSEVQTKGDAIHVVAEYVTQTRACGTTDAFGRVQPLVPLTAEQKKKAFHPAVKVTYDKGDKLDEPLVTYMFLYRTRGETESLRILRCSLTKEQRHSSSLVSSRERLYLDLSQSRTRK
jgi:hypothetical protein